MKLVFRCWLVGLLSVLLVGHVQAKTKTSKRPVKKMKRGSSRLGDVSLRVSLGVETIMFSNVVGELTTTRIGDRGAVGLLMTPEYGYFLNDSTVLLAVLPVAMEVNPNVGVFPTVSLGIGARKYFLRYIFAEAQVLLQFLNRGNLRAEFGGFLFGFGLAFPFLSRYQLFAYAQIPFNFYPGIQVGANVLVGIEVLF
ncbi:MAG: hypothetical protein CL920_10730 [Deltaproteobacteria bacterium]|nr:hypothetical protein [Deltaproteobacteria bacterium]MBU49161.1 hypothetical protein [Deltaproteobacteria bacterium]|tara:strand:+ start:12170 stop:12757 length:588 start_codon:yes stop_codon:yes gene_type:complete